ncbi:helix-turn-helix domain-containing protein [Blastochloris tepida]|uniref:HTH cro/C1-type domain-containing protein n=1 Tax=Blastochloris tepida TaxID=2233851 RepID=A0A348FZE0_9HYPH|nr:helix-turn-helix domain-containing protein [Blastochloris tepida]BBF92673.1 hypothetical protein BLTE_13580 [Blastochloris tepida]
MIDRSAFISARVAIGMSQSELAEAVGCAQQTIGAIEAGHTKSSKLLPRIADILGVSVLDLDKDFLVPTKTPAAKNYAVETSCTVLELRSLAIKRASDGTVTTQFQPGSVGSISIGNGLGGGSYAVVVALDDMAPELRPGETAVVDGAATPLAGELHIFQSADGGVMFRNLVSADHAEGVYVVESWKSKSRETINACDWPLIQRVIGKFARK